MSVKFINVMISVEQHRDYLTALVKNGRSIKRDITEYIESVIEKSKETKKGVKK